MKRFVFTLAILLSMMFVSTVQTVQAVGSDVNVQCNLSVCTVTPNAVPVFDEQNIWPGYTVTHTISAQNTTDQNGQFGLVAQEYGSEQSEEELSNPLNDHIFIEIRQGSAVGPVVYGGGSSKTLADLFADTSVTQIVLGSMGPNGSDQYFVKATFDPDAGNQLMNASVVFDLDLGFLFSPIPPANGGNGNPAGRSSNGGSGGNGGNSGGGPGPAPTCTEPAPTNAPSLFFIEGNTSDGQVTLGWSAATGANNYAINFGVQPGNYLYGNNSVGNVTSYTVTGLTPGGNYYFQVLGIYNCAPGPRSNEFSTGGSAILGLVNAPNGFGGQVLGEEVLVATEEATATPSSGSVAGQILGEETCNTIKQYLPLVFLLIQVISALVIYALMRRPENRIKQIAVLAIASILTMAFYFLRSCNCFEATIWSFLCQWYVVVAVALAGALQFVNYSLIEKEE